MRQAPVKLCNKQFTLVSLIWSLILVEISTKINLWLLLLGNIVDDELPKHLVNVVDQM
ncbi:hypothetical protein Fmac_003270 [Flemingia macrophylla]|uniref:Uncharacterized protein n=1 Tax=Flemingia macrophylla TaxID=520843 RepID=A0ABD1NMB5_9FABA